MLQIFFTKQYKTIQSNTKQYKATGIYIYIYLVMNILHTNTFIQRNTNQYKAIYFTNTFLYKAIQSNTNIKDLEKILRKKIP